MNPRLVEALRIGTAGFPVWVFVCSAVALVRPEAVTWIPGRMITLGLGVIMLGMGLTLTLEDFRRVLVSPLPIGLGVILQFLVMPLLGFALAAAFDLPTGFAVGLILVSCCPGGVASNVISYLALANVPLSVSMTAVSTAASALMTPALTALLASSRVEVPLTGLLISTVQVVILPVAAGLALNRYAPRVSRTLLPWGPFTAVFLITVLVASIIGASREAILASAGPLIGAIVCLHAGGFGFGYLLSRVLGRGEAVARTIAIEVGMQNSGLGVVLARANFTNPAVAAPSAISSLVHSLVGSALAALWRGRSPGDPGRGPAGAPHESAMAHAFGGRSTTSG